MRRTLWMLLLVLLSSLCLAADVPTGRLLAAARAGGMAGVRAALADGADPMVTDQDGATALHRAVWSGQTDVGLALLEGGAAPDVLDDERTAPLHWAAVLIATARGPFYKGSGAPSRPRVVALRARPPAGA